MSKTIISVRLKPDLLEKISCCFGLRFRTRSTFIRSAIETLLHEESPV
jgi:metal-responsive CopG/Arc/MetJ family transcriptional regulator